MEKCTPSFTPPFNPLSYHSYLSLTSPAPINHKQPTPINPLTPLTSLRRSYDLEARLKMPPPPVAPHFSQSFSGSAPSNPRSQSYPLDLSSGEESFIKQPSTVHKKLASHTLLYILFCLV